MLRTAFDWVLSWSNSEYGTIALFLIAFIESFFLLPPPDIPLMALVLGKPSRFVWYASVATVGSALGGMVGYAIGANFGQGILKKFFSSKTIATCHDYFEKYEVWAIGIAGFTPVPYKVFTISAGLFRIDFKKFTAISFISRGARFFLVACLLGMYGETIKEFILRYFNLLSVAFLLIIAVCFYFFRPIGKPSGYKGQ